MIRVYFFLNRFRFVFMLPNVILGAEASACSQKVTQDIATIIMEGMK